MRTPQCPASFKRLCPPLQFGTCSKAAWLDRAARKVRTFQYGTVLPAGLFQRWRVSRTQKALTKDLLDEGCGTSPDGFGPGYCMLYWTARHYLHTEQTTPSTFSLITTRHEKQETPKRVATWCRICTWLESLNKQLWVYSTDMLHFAWPVCLVMLFQAFLESRISCRKAPCRIERASALVWVFSLRLDDSWPLSVLLLGSHFQRQLAQH